MVYRNQEDWGKNGGVEGTQGLAWLNSICSTCETSKWGSFPGSRCTCESAAWGRG